MKIELKKISFSERMSEETNCFVADLYINGKRVGECKNDGRGGCTNYYGTEKYHSDIIKEAEAYCKTLPKVKYGDMEWEQSLEGVIDQLLEDYLKAKEEKKKANLMKKAILVGDPNGNGYAYYRYKVELRTLPKAVLQKHLDGYRAKLKKGEVILNTNLAELGVK
jgi:hypothetical protein